MGASAGEETLTGRCLASVDFTVAGRRQGERRKTARPKTQVKKSGVRGRDRRMETGEWTERVLEDVIPGFSLGAVS